MLNLDAEPQYILNKVIYDAVDTLLGFADSACKSGSLKMCLNPETARIQNRGSLVS